MPTFRVDYRNYSPRFLAEPDERFSWDRPPERVVADGYTIDDTWVTFWADQTRGLELTPPPVLRVRTDDALRIEWLDRPEPAATTAPLRITYRVMSAITERDVTPLYDDSGHFRDQDEIAADNYRTGHDYLVCVYAGFGEPEDVQPPVLAVRSDRVERVERLDMPPTPAIDQSQASAT